MAPGTRTDPYLGFRFVVEINSLNVAGFSEVSGLGIEIETEDYEEGGRNDYTHQFPGQTSYTNVELRRGMTTSRALVDWVRNVVDGRFERKNVEIFLLDSQGRQVRGWQCKDAYPVRYSGPDLQADQPAVAVEVLELTHNELSEIEVGG